MTLTRWIAAVFVGAVLTAVLGWSQAWGEAASTLLEKGIYEEQTTGDLDAAMRIYKQVTDDDQANRPVAAQAQYRLGLCQLKKKQPDAAAESFRKVISLYPEQKDLVAQAQEKLDTQDSPPAGSSLPAVAGRPAIVRTNPLAFATNVDPLLDKITVTFSMPMMEGSWSWTGGGETYPQTTGKPSYDPERRTCTLPVKLEPGKAYWIGVNSRDFKNFRSAMGIPAPWYVIVFATRSADGKPTPIPQDMLAKARQLNTASVKGPPVVVGTAPNSFANEVDPALARVSVTFDQPMMNGSWSWVQYSNDLYPTESGDPTYDGTGRTCSLPVKLEPGHVYMIGFNGPDYHYFQNPGHMPAQPYVLLFATRSAEGKPTPFPEDLVAQVERFNATPGSPVPQYGSQTRQGATNSPRVVRTEPATYSTDVSPTLTNITVAFDRKMADGSWSWTGGGDTYPKTTGKPSYDAPRRVCTLPVKLEPGKVYQVGVNSVRFKNFRAEDGTPANRYVILFSTLGADGKPTPIPQDLLDQAREINGASVVTRQAGKELAAVQSGNGGGNDDKMQKRPIGKAVAIFPEQVDLATPEGAAAAWNRASGKMDAASLANLSWLPLSQAELDRVWKSADKKDIETYNKSQLNGVIIEVLTYKDDFAGVVTFLSFPPGVGRSPYSLRYLGQSNGQWKNMGEDRLASVAEARQTFERKMERIREQFHEVIGGGNGSSCGSQNQASADKDRQRAIEQVFADPEPIVMIANKIFEAIRAADYDRWINGEGWGSFPMVQYYQTYQWYDVLVPWICKTFKADPIKDVSLGKVTKNEDGLPAIPYKLALASGKVMEGVLPFNYKDGRWYARWGLDWHLGDRIRLTEAKKAAQPAGGPAKVEVRDINKPVSAFTAGDLSTPESAAASYNRASGGMDAKALAAVSLAPVDQAEMQRSFDRNRADMEVYNRAQLTATIVKVLNYRDGVAMVVTMLNFPEGVGRHPYSGRMFGLFNGQWKNMGEDRYPNPEAAQAAFEKVKDMVWDDYAQTVQGQKGGGGDLGAASGESYVYRGVGGSQNPDIDAHQREAEQHPEIIEAEAKWFFNAIRTADYDRWLKGGEDWWTFPVKEHYETDTGLDAWVLWICKTFKQNPITDVQLGRAVKNVHGLMGVHYKLTLKDGAVLEGDLPFYWNVNHWHGMHGIDWHLKYKGKPLVVGAYP